MFDYGKKVKHTYVYFYLMETQILYNFINEY